METDALSQGGIVRESSKLFEHFSTSKSQKEKVSLVWSNIEYSVLVKDSKGSGLCRTAYKCKKILKSLNGNAISGELIAIMGPTGCGKTSLLNVLASRMTGEITVNGKSRNDISFRKLSAYVLQDDRLYPYLTVHETLLLAAHFFLPSSTTLTHKEELVSSIILELGLGRTRDTIIGDERVRGVSGGERKRANIAVQLISNPSVLFLDEPTSGLDSFQAQAVMESMKCMAMNGRLVVTVIHQPRSSIFDMFDKLLLLSEGRVMYHGDAHGAAKYFENAGFKCHKFFNPADFYLDILSPDQRTAEKETATRERIDKFATLWIESVAVKSNTHTDDIDHCISANVDTEQTAVVKTDSFNMSLSTNTKTTTITLFDWKRFFHNLSILFWRSWCIQMRNSHALIVRFCTIIFFALVISGMYSNLNKSQAGILDREGLFFMIIINNSFANSIATLNTFPNEKQIVNRERANGAYDTLSYFFAKFIAELPMIFMPQIVFSCITYYITGLNPDRFGYYLLIVIFHAVTALSLGLAISAFSPTSTAATAIFMPILVVNLLFGGFYINIKSLPIVANWVPYVSSMRWTFEALCINEFAGERYPCPLASMTTDGCLATGDQILATLSFQNATIGDAMLGQGMMCIAFILAAIVCLEYSQLKFISLGHTGSMFLKHDTKHTM